MSDKKIRLIYFDTRGLGEFIRLILTEAGADFEDVRIKREDWPTLKTTMPFGTLPALEYNGKTITQSRAVARFVAREYNMAGESSWEAATVDMIMESGADLMPKFYPVINEQDATKKAEGIAKFTDETFVPYLKHLEDILVKNGGDFLVGKKITCADIAVANILAEMVSYIGDGWTGKFPKLIEFRDKIMARPNIKQYIEKRAAA